MVTLLETLGDPNPQTTSKFYICVAIYIKVGERRDFKFCAQVDHSKSQPMDDKMVLKGVWSRHVTNFKCFTPTPQNISGTA